MGGSAEARVGEIRTCQHGVIAVRQAVDAGLAKSTVYDWIDRGRYQVVCRGVIAVAGDEITPIGLLQAHLLATGDRTAAGGHSALALHGLCEHPPEPEVVSWGCSRVRVRGIHVSSKGRLTSRDLVWRDGMRCLNLEWALIETAAGLPRDRAEDALDRALASRRTTLDRFAGNSKSTPAARLLGPVTRAGDGRGP